MTKIETSERFCRYGTALYQIELDRVSETLGRQAEAQELRPQEGERVFQCLEACLPQCPNLVDVDKLRERRWYDDLKFGYRAFVEEVFTLRRSALERSLLLAEDEIAIPSPS